jgi:acyl-CoA synthetase (AMP-forming)/AMP-acid ligase II
MPTRGILPMTMQLLERIASQARANGSRIAYREVAGDAREISYAKLWRATQTFARNLRNRIALGGVVMLCLPNQIEYPIAFLGILAAGCTVFPVSPESAEPELVTLARESKAAAIIGTSRSIAAVKDQAPLAIETQEILDSPNASQVSEESPGMIGSDLLLCSSGTTSRPKIVIRSATSLDAVARSTCNAVGFTAEDRVLAIVPLCHSYGLEHGLLAPLWAGSTVHLCAGLDLGVSMAELTAAKITLFPSTPSVYDMMCEIGEAAPLPALRKAYAAGAPLPPSVFDAFSAKYGVQIGQLYGATEIGSVAFANPHADHFDPRSVGRPFEGVRVRIIDRDTSANLPTGSEGQVMIAAPSMFRGYLHETSTSITDGFFPTGDLGRIDAFGNLTITGRLKLLIEVAGQKVNVLELESLLMQHPSVSEAVVVAIPASETVSRLKAIVTPTDPAHPPAPEELRQFLRERVSAYKIPRLIEVQATLPRSPAGKILRRLLEEQ